MKKIFITIFILYSFCANAQLLNVFSFNQNDSIGIGINNLIVNGGFENNTCPASTGVIGSQTSFCPNSAGYICDLSDWICTGGGYNTYACVYTTITNKCMIEEGLNAAYFGSFYCHACSSIDDDTSCLVMNGCIVSGIPSGYPLNTSDYGGANGVSLQQTVTGLTIDNTYILEFWAGGEEYMNNSSVFAVDVGFGNILLREKPTPIGGTGTRFLIEFLATSSSHTVKFTNWGHICETCTELVIDDVRMYNLEELSDSVRHGLIGVNELEATNSQLIISPNPVADKCTIHNSEFKIGTAATITVYNILGVAVQSELRNRKSEMNVDVEGLPSGIYIIEVSSSEKVFRSKFVKQ